MKYLVNKSNATVATLEDGVIVEGIERAAAHLKHNIALFADRADGEQVDLAKILRDTEDA